MKSLGEVADRQTPALQQLDAAAPQLTQFLDRLAPFAKASRPALRSLGQASITGDRAAKAAKPTVALLNGVAAGTPEAAKDLAIILEHLDDRKNAIEKDPRSSGGQGYSRPRERREPRAGQRGALRRLPRGRRVGDAAGAPAERQGRRAGHAQARQEAGRGCRSTRK
jgi:hypothetical protein